MTDTLRPLERSGRRGRRRLSPVQKYEAFVQVLTGEMTVVQCADHWGVDRGFNRSSQHCLVGRSVDARRGLRLGSSSRGSFGAGC